MTTLTEQQIQIVHEVASLAKLKGLPIETKDDMDKVMRIWIQNNFTANYFGNEDFKKNADRQIINSLQLK